MEATESVGILYGAAIVVLFAVSFLAGDIAGIIIERQSAHKWRISAGKIGFEFDGRKRRSHYLSEIFLPKLLFPGAEETAFSYCQIIKSVSGSVQGLDMSINDFTVWDFHTRGPVIYRAVLCIVNGDKIEVPGPICVAKTGSTLFYGFQQDKALKEYTVLREDGFSLSYALFSRGGSFPWIFTPELQRFCVEHRHELDCLIMNTKDIMLIWVEKRPERFPQLIDLALGIASRLLEAVPQLQAERDA